MKEQLSNKKRQATASAAIAIVLAFALPGLGLLGITLEPWLGAAVLGGALICFTFALYRTPRLDRILTRVGRTLVTLLVLAGGIWGIAVQTKKAHQRLPKAKIQISGVDFLTASKTGLPFNYSYRNIGSLPSTASRFASGAFPSNRELTKQELDRVYNGMRQTMVEHPQDGWSSVPLQAGGDGQWKTGDAPHITESDIKAINAGEKRLYVFIIGNYRDENSDSRWTEFCASYEHNRFVPVLCEAHNTIE